MIHLEVVVAGTAELLSADAYGPGALLRWESSATYGGVYAEGGTIPLVSGTSVYNIWDAAGTATTWYRTRVSDAGGTTFSVPYEGPFQWTQFRAYATPELVKARLAGNFDTADDALIQSLCLQANAYIEGPQGAGRILAPRPEDTYYFDGDGSRCLFFDCVSVSEVAIALQTGGTYTVLPTTDYFLRPLPQDRDIGWPGTRIELSDYPTGGFWYYPPGYATVRVVAVAGWPMVPDDIVDVAVTMVVRAWHARQSGQTDIVGNDETGAPIVSRYISGRDRETLRAYRVARPVR